MASKAAVLDSAGAGLSGLCLVHCLALPLVSLALPAVANLAEAEWVHAAVVALAAPIAAWALLGAGPGPRPPAGVILSGLAGLGLMAFGAFGPHEAERWASVAGGLALAGAHLANWRWRHSVSTRRPGAAEPAPHA